MPDGENADYWVWVMVGSVGAESRPHHMSILSLPQSLQPLINKLRDHLLQDSKLALGAVFEVPSHTLLHILADLVDFDVDLLAGLLACCDDLLLSVCDEHDLPKPLGAVLDLGDGQACSVYCHVALLDDVAQHGGVSRLEAEGEGITVGRHGLDGCGCVDVALDKVAAHARVCRDGALEVDLGALLQRAQVGAAERLGRAPNLERLLVKLGDSQTCSCIASALWPRHTLLLLYR